MPPKRKVKARKLDPRKTREPVEGHPRPPPPPPPPPPTPDSDSEESDTSVITTILTDMDINSDAPPPAQDTDTDVNSDDSDTDSDSDPPLPQLRVPAPTPVVFDTGAMTGAALHMDQAISMMEARINDPRVREIRNRFKDLVLSIAKTGLQGLPGVEAEYYFQKPIPQAPPPPQPARRFADASTEPLPLLPARTYAEAAVQASEPPPAHRSRPPPPRSPPEAPPGQPGPPGPPQPPGPPRSPPQPARKQPPLPPIAGVQSPQPAVRAVVLHAAPTHRKPGEMRRWLEEDNKIEIAGVRWLLQEGRRLGKAASSLVIYLATPILPGKLNMGRKCFRTTSYDWDRGKGEAEV